MARMVRAAVARAMEPPPTWRTSPTTTWSPPGTSTFGADDATVLADEIEAGDPTAVGAGTDHDTDDDRDGGQPLYRLTAGAAGDAAGPERAG